MKNHWRFTSANTADRENPVVELEQILDASQPLQKMLCPKCMPAPSIHFRPLPPNSTNKQNHWSPKPVVMRRQTFFELQRSLDRYNRPAQSVEFETFAFFGQCEHCKTIYCAKGR